MSGRKRGGDAPDDDRAAKRRENAEAISRGAQDLTPVTALARLDDLVRKWQLDRPSTTFEQQISNMFLVFGLDPDDDLLDRLNRDRGSFGLKEIEDAVVASEVESVALYHRLRELGALPTKGCKDPEKHEALKKIVKVFEAVFYAKKVVLSAFQAKLGAHQLHVPDASSLDLGQDLDARLGSWALRFRYIDDDTTDFMRLVMYLLDAAMEKRYRKCDGWMYEPIVIDGVDVHAWKRAVEIAKFAPACLPKETQWDMWKAAYKSGMKNLGSAIEYLTKCVDFQLPELVKQRGVYAFRNGVYFCKDDLFHDFAADGALSDQVVACKYFDMDFAPADDWRDIPTPFLDSIAQFQEWDAGVCEWLYVFSGRLLYPTGELDQWQVAPFFKGVASSGKSTILLKVYKHFYEASDVGTLGNNIEHKFGLSALHDKFLVLGPEIRSDFALDQAEYQSIVSGESVQVNIKHQTAKSVDEWTAPIAFAGNEVPNWADSGGAIQRRTPVFDFTVSVTNGDMKLGDKLFLELPAIIQKCNKAYLEKVRRHADVNVWTILPEAFHANRKALAMETCAIEALMDQPDVRRGAALFCPLADFSDRLKDFATRYGLRHSGRFGKDAWIGPFGRLGLKVVREERGYRGGPVVFGDWVAGMDFTATEMINVLG
jgi:hypothetical protein